MNKLTPSVRQWLYTISAIASALVPLLVTYRVMDSSTGSAWINLVGLLGALGSGGAATAAVVVRKQRHEGMLDFTGTPAEQAVAAVEAIVTKAGAANSDLNKVRDAVEAVLGNASGIAKATIEQIQSMTCGDKLK